MPTISITQAEAQALNALLDCELHIRHPELLHKIHPEQFKHLLSVHDKLFGASILPEIYDAN